uniref:Uncharacterized protein n=1 Tax=Gadus morhua TaxID=8049 RepID=A0A8C5B8C8_GADMO
MAVTGFSVQDGALFLNDRAVPTMTLLKALTSFLDFLRSLEQPVLVPNSICPRALLRCSLHGHFQQLGSSFLDTLRLSKMIIQGKRYNINNALDDVMTLQELYSCWNPDQWDVVQCSFEWPLQPLHSCPIQGSPSCCRSPSEKLIQVNNCTVLCLRVYYMAAVVNSKKSKTNIDYF